MLLVSSIGIIAPHLSFSSILFDVPFEPLLRFTTHRITIDCPRTEYRDLGIGRCCDNGPVRMFCDYAPDCLSIC